MNKKLLKVLACLMLGVSTVGVSSISSEVSAHAVGDMTCDGCVYSDVCVYDANSFATAVTSAKNGTRIVLTNDVCLDRNVDIKASVVIDLNGYKLEMKNGTVIGVGAKVFDHTETYSITHPGYYTTEKVVSNIKNPDIPICDAYGNLLYYQQVPDTEVVSWEKVWHPAWTETKTRDIYNYLDSIDVMIKNGIVKGSRGVDGADGTENTFNDCNGEKGSQGYAAIDVMSGVVRVHNASIIGGDGGNGGDGKYQAIMHIPFFTGNGGNGGRGGKSGHAVVLERSGARVVEEEGATLLCGEPGKGGKAGAANENHWVGHGKEGKVGKSGKRAKPILKNY